MVAEVNFTSGITSFPSWSMAGEISKVANAIAAAIHTDASARNCPGQTLWANIGMSGLGEV